MVPVGDELVVEATQGLREWCWKLRELYKVRLLEITEKITPSCTAWVS